MLIAYIDVKQLLGLSSNVRERGYFLFPNPNPTHTLDLLRLGTGGSSFFDMATNTVVLSAWMLRFLYVGQMFHKMIMKRE